MGKLVEVACLVYGAFASHDQLRMQSYSLKADLAAYGMQIAELQATGIKCTDGGECCRKHNATEPCIELAILHLAPWTAVAMQPAYGPAAWLAATTLLRRINHDQQLLPGFKITLDPWNSQHDETHASLAMFHALATKRYVAAFAGDNAASGKYKYFDVIQLPATFVTDAVFKDAHHMLINPPDMAVAELDAIVSICKHFDLAGFALVLGSDYPPEAMDTFRAGALEHNLSIYFAYHYSGHDDMGLQLDMIVRNIRLSRARVIVWFGNGRVDQFLCRAAALQMQDLLLIGPPYYGPEFSTFALMECGLNVTKNRTATLLEVGQWLPRFNQSRKADQLITGVGMTGDEFDQAWLAEFDKYGVPPLPFPGAVQMFADSVLHLVLMLKAVLIDEQVPVDVLYQRQNTTVYELIYENLLNISFDGVDGKVMFGGSERGVTTDRLRRWSTAVFQSYPAEPYFWPVSMILDPYLSGEVTPELVNISDRYVQSGFPDVRWLNDRAPASKFPNCRDKGMLMNYSGDQCAQCPPGSEIALGETHLEDHCAWCPVGKFGSGVSICQVCPKGTFTDSEGLSACLDCPIGRTSQHDTSSACEIDSFYYLCATLVSAVYALAWICALIFFEQWLGIPICDVSSEGSKVVLTTHGRHLILHRRSVEVNVALRSTGNHMLACSGKPWKVRVLTCSQLELLGETKDPSKLDTSRGMLFVVDASGLWSRGFVVPFLMLVPMLLSFGAYSARVISASPPTSILCVSGLLATLMWRWSRQVCLTTPLLATVANYRERLLSVHTPTPCPRGPYRAITVARLTCFYDHFQSFVRERNAYYLVANIVTPLTQDKKLSFAEYSGPSLAKWFCSHYWGTEFRHFCASVKSHALALLHHSEDWQRMTYWICFLSNNQWQVEDELGHGDWRQSSFYLALQGGVEGTALILDDHAMPLTRTWCLFEILQTLILEQQRQGDCSFHGLHLCTSVGVLNFGATSVEVAMSTASRLSELALQDATASSLEDKRMIDQLVEAQPGGFLQMNRFVRRKMRMALVNAKVHFEAEFQDLFEKLSSDTSPRRNS